MFGGHFGGTVSAEIGRRMTNNVPLGPLLRVVKVLGQPLLGRFHWVKAFRKEQIWFDQMDRD